MKVALLNSNDEVLSKHEISKTVVDKLIDKAGKSGVKMSEVAASGLMIFLYAPEEEIAVDL